MPHYLVFNLAAQIAAFGGPAGHERRGGDTWPGRSALIGLIAGALGIRREDRGGQERLGTLAFAVAAYDTGHPLRDYHTVQSVPNTIKQPATRADALRRGAVARKLNTSITQRDYRTGVRFTVAAWDRDGTHDLDALAAALRRPTFTPYLGRKSCPLSAPMEPTIFEAETPLSALGASRRAGGNAPLFVAAEHFDGLKDQAASVSWRHDDPLDRTRWHFGVRPVHVLRGEAMGWNSTFEESDA